MDTSLDSWFKEEYFFFIQAIMLDKWTNMTDVEEEKTVILLLSSNGQRTETAPVQIFQLIIVSSLLISFCFKKL